MLADEASFGTHVERHRRELHVHCYRMLASFDEAEDAVQETFLRAWRARERFAGGSLLRAWLYRIATNVCLDSIRARRARSVADIGWLQPYPDVLLDEVVSTDDGPDTAAVARETIELAFLVALQVLPPHQRAALILRDGLGLPATETAELLETSIAAANSAVQRARAAMQRTTCPHTGSTGGRSSPARRSGPCSTGSSTRTSAATPRGDGRRGAGHPRHDAPGALLLRRARRHRIVAGAGLRPRPGRRLAPRRDVGQPDARPRPATCGGPATPRSGRSSWTCCGPRRA